MILSASKLLSLHPNTLPLDNGALVINHGVIWAVGPANRIINKYPGHRVIRLDNAILMPGLVNLHTHLELPPLLDAIRAKTFTGWVLNLITEKKSLVQTDYKAAASINIRTLIQTGTTTVGEICTHGISPGLLKRSGLRGVLFQEIIHMGAERYKSSMFNAQCSKLQTSLLTRGLSPHTPYTVSEPALHAINRLSNNKNIPLAMHIAESKDEIWLLQRKKTGLERLYQFAHWDLGWAPTGSSSFEYLNRIGVLSPRLLAVHAVQVTDEDIALIKKSKTSIAHCPRSNKEIGVGRMPLKKLLGAGIPVGLGTDSLASSPSLNLWDEMRYTFKIHRRDGVTPLDIFKMATIGGAKALGMDKEIGILEVGKRADIIAVPLPKKNTGNLYSDLLRETESCIMTMVNGKVLYSGEEL